MKPRRISCLCLLVLGLFSTASPAQSVKRMTVEEALAFVDPKSPTFVNGTEADETRPFPPHRIVGNLYYVGTETIASFLIVTPQGNILINSTFERTVPVIQQAVEKLGFNFKDTKILATSHGHADHVEGDAMVKELTGAQVVVMAEDVEPERKIMPGGKPHPIDRIIHDREQITLGGTTLTAYLTPAHTPGCTTWTMQVSDAGKTYNVVIQGCGLGTGRLVD